MTVTRAGRLQLFAVMAILVVLQFYLRPRLWASPFSPDFLFIALMLYAMRSRPGAGALAGFIVGIVADSLSPARFGAAALAHSFVGYLGSWSRALFFSDNLLVNAAFIAAGLWIRNLMVLMASGTGGGALAHEMLVYAPVQALTTAGSAVLVLLVFREWFAIRLDI